MLKRFNSLQAILLLHELSFVLLILITGFVGIAWSVSWQQSSAESLRIGSMNTKVQNLRGELYRQLKEVFDASFLHDTDAIDEYQSYTRIISADLDELYLLATDQQEENAISNMSKAYDAFYEQTYELLRSEYIGREQKLLLDNGLEQKTFAELEITFLTLDTILESKQQQLSDSRARWSKRFVWFVSLPVLIAISLLLVSRRFLKKSIVHPLADVINGAKLISKGKLAHDVPLVGVTELVRLAEAINTMAAELIANRDSLVETKKQAEMGALVPLVAHNIRNPLAGIRAASQVALDEEISEPGKDTLTDIIVAVDRLERWVSSLLSYLHPTKPHFSETTLIHVADNALSLIELQCVDKRINIHRVGWENTTKSINVDIHLFEQVLFNLIQNALEASKNEDRIELHYYEQDNMVSLQIIDQGEGLTFDPISEKVIDGEAKRLGCGLGIPFALKIIKQHGGTLSYRDATTAGTIAEIKLSLPS